MYNFQNFDSLDMKIMDNIENKFPILKLDNNILPDIRDFIWIKKGPVVPSPFLAIKIMNID